MTHPSSRIARHSPAALYLFLEAIRCRSAARRSGQPVLASLHARLGRHGWAQLLPAIDSLLGLTETMLGRQLRTGRGPALSEDENMMINLLQGRRIAPIAHACSDAVACAFCSAVRSVQILMDMELGRPGQRQAA
ncbi:hypothetical protein DM806_14775 [Sphingobium lactosutens]|mgnify:CR=1 FL=1|uniref:hypothetical protein n=1 Tax=Sphingobium lactosutens TaxID=522773 RepID=UPI0015BA45E5|nr:hypothetical protein [Sphingobium lactosutens]NWK96906.1 hypothetical protein [Sphingobium lactosutens]